MSGRDRHAVAVGGANRVGQQLADHLVTGGDDADLPPLRQQGADHPRAGIGLARAGRPLNRQLTAAQLAGDPDREIRSGFPGRTGREAGHRRGRPAEQEVPDDGLGVETVLEHSLGDAHQRRLLRVGIEDVERDDRRRMRLVLIDAFPDVDRPGLLVDGLDLTERPIRR